MSKSANAKCLIVNADDYGFTPGVSEGIRRAHLQGIVTSTSVMMTMPCAVAELARLPNEAPALGVGVHLTVTQGRPFRLSRFFAPAALPSELEQVDAADLRSEWRAQIEVFLATGTRLTHLDSHHHAAYRHPRALATLFDLAREYRVPVRNPYPLGQPEADGLAASFAGSGVSCPDRFVDVFDQILSAPVLVQALDAVSVGVTEFMLHPGLVDDELRKHCPTHAPLRAAELAALVHPDARAAVGRLGIELVSFAVLSAAE